MFHGYLSTVCVLHILHDIPLPADIKDEGYFLDLAGRGEPPALHDEPVGETQQPAAALSPDTTEGPLDEQHKAPTPAVGRN